MSSEIIPHVITKAKIPTKTFYRINDNCEEVEITIEEGILPNPLGSNHENKYYYNKEKKLCLVIKTDSGDYEAKEIIVGGILPDSLDASHIGNYYCGHEEASLGVSSFSRIWGGVEDSEGNLIKDSKGKPITLNLQDAMNALFKMMASQSHVWVGSETDAPDYAKLLIETDKQ